MKLFKVRHSQRISKILAYLLIFVGFQHAALAQIPQTVPQTQIPGNQLPDGVTLQDANGKQNVGTTNKQLPVVDEKGARKVNLTEGEQQNMTHEDSVRAAMEQQETEELELEALRRKIFGTKLFNITTYDPNAVINIPTPNNYVLGTNDQLTIDLYGYSQNHEEVTVNTDGYINLAKAGLINVSGMTISEATSNIKKALSPYYFGVSNGTTKIKLSLGDVRTIKVTITGEVIAPGTYTMSSLNTIMNALYRSGGPNELGSFRQVNLIRENKVVASLDLYDLLLKGYSDKNLLLHDQDIIQVPTYKNRIKVYGETKREGIFESIEGENIDDALRFAGGFAPNAYQHKLKIYRNNTREREIYDVPLSNFSGFPLQAGDSLVIEQVLKRFSNLVSIEGAVYRPGEYSLNSNKTISQLIGSAEGLKTEALAGRISLVRTNEDLTSSNISINYQDILNGSAPDIELQREDEILVPSKFELIEESTIRISGAINNPDAEEGVELPFVKDMSIEDVIVRVGGLTEAASLSRVEVVRRKKNIDVNQSNAQVSEIFELDVTPDLLVVSGKKDLKLQAFDEVIVKKSPNYEEQTFVEVQGEVVYPAKYGIQSKEERVSDIIRRANGLTLQAYVPGATLIRTVKLSEVELEQKRKAYEELENANDKTQIIELEEVEETVQESIGIDLAKILKNPGSDEDLIVRDGDIIQIPKKLETVRVRGEVLYPTTEKFYKNYNFKRYISGAGGFTKGSLKRKAYIRYPNGSIDRTKKFLVFNVYPKVEPGSEIIVPVKAQNAAQQLNTIGTIVGTVATTLTTLAGVLTLIQVTK
ncbi:SLBB domain-containing protein [Marinilongibacter aquaticus]|uniref:polysaccharide biosynthesis/export family protein n=1 Tax=Marinilongibacter aquaticus TaxID=2975157 RepID=UPI0021BD2086|nr:SLBB domain-containing protein [Marinilongibacter aquaticus]UBM59308.1 SLBB domain-containing protein [Marinilongibacter aquaticus]